jgi:hypothetical protein
MVREAILRHGVTSTFFVSGVVPRLAEDGCNPSHHPLEGGWPLAILGTDERQAKRRFFHF